MYEFEKYPKLTEFIQEMANTGRVPREWTTFLETLNQALRIHDVVGRSEQFNCLGGNYAKGIKPCSEWCGEDMCQKPSN